MWIKPTISRAWRAPENSSSCFAFGDLGNGVIFCQTPSGFGDISGIWFLFFVNGSSNLEAKHFLCDLNLNYTDKMGMAAGVEVRVPLLDPDLIALAARLPVKYKQRGRIGKWVFKKAMEPYLPREVIYRPKTGFGAPLRYWMKHQLRPVIEDVLSESSLRNRGLFDPLGVQNLIALDRHGKVDAAYTIFSLLCIELWCRIFC
ncbi:MAG: asparagine synthase [bacterium]|nr:asparagine synthase [bacterium]